LSQLQTGTLQHFSFVILLDLSEMTEVWIEDSCPHTKEGDKTNGKLIKKYLLLKFYADVGGCMLPCER
jgi:hypothetical protein